MFKLNLPLKSALNLILCLCLLASPLGFQAAYAQTDGAADSVTPTDPAGPAYILTVNSTGDANTKDANLTLREALMLARGGTTALGVNRPLSDGEKAQITGCTFTGSANNWSTATGCGSTYADIIQFSASLGYGAIIAISAALPTIADSASTTIDGGTVIPFINASLVASGAALTISSNQNVLKNFGIYATPLGPNFLVSGSSNIFQNVRAHSGGHEGMLITGSSNQISGAKIGVSELYTCLGNSWSGIAIEDPGVGTSSGNTIKNSVVGCNNYGILDATTGGYHIIGPGNYIGINPAENVDLGNLGEGVGISSDHNQVLGNIIRNNNWDGLSILSGFNVVMTNTITANGDNGILIASAATFNFIGCNFLCAIPGGNRLAGNGHYGIELRTTGIGTETRYNQVVANNIGFSADGMTAEPNSLGGVLLYGAHDNFIGSNGAQYANYIGGNLFSGIKLDNGAYNNKIYNNKIGLSRTSGNDHYMPNGWRGIHLLNGAHDNTIGGATTSLGNEIAFSGMDGIYIAGSTITNNTIDNNAIHENQSAGIRIDASAHDNTVGSAADKYNVIGGNKSSGIILSNLANHNTIGYNHIGGNFPPINGIGNLYGIEILTGANNNTIGGTTSVAGQAMNDIEANVHAGVLIDGPSTTLNTLANNVIGNNQHGVVITNTANNNTLASNYIGMRADLSVIGNNLHGVYLTGGANNNQIGINGGGNRIANNLYIGIAIQGATTAYNQVNDNLIYANEIGGLEIGLSANHNTIGSYLMNANDIGGNLGFGVLFDNSAHHNTFSYNNVGILGASAYPNLTQGVQIGTASHDNTFFNNTIANNLSQGVYMAGVGTVNNSFTLNFIHDNKLDGIVESSLANNNWWSHVSMWGNGGMAIDKFASSDTANNPNPPFPRITSVTFANGLYTIQGTATASAPGSKLVKVEVYIVGLSTAGFAEGKTYLTEGTVAANGHWSATTSGPVSGCYVAFETVTEAGVTTSSEFGRSTCTVYAPAMRR